MLSNLVKIWRLVVFFLLFVSFNVISVTYISHCSDGSQEVGPFKYA